MFHPPNEFWCKMLSRKETKLKSKLTKVIRGVKVEFCVLIGVLGPHFMKCIQAEKLYICVSKAVYYVLGVT